MCRFCEKYSLMQKMDLHSKVAFEFSSAALEENSVLQNGFYGRIIYHLKNGISFDLNYCPECGRNIAELED